LKKKKKRKQRREHIIKRKYMSKRSFEEKSIKSKLENIERIHFKEKKIKLRGAK